MNHFQVIKIIKFEYTLELLILICYLGYLNDLWRCNIEIDTWTWISGSNKLNQKAVYGIRGKPDEKNIPGSRHSSYTWMDIENQKLSMFGGYGYSEDEPGNYLFEQLLIYNLTLF